MGHGRRYWVAVAVIGIGCALVVRPRHQQLLYPAASLKETTASVRGVHTHEHWWMQAGDAAVRFSWKLLWSWRR